MVTVSTRSHMNRSISFACVRSLTSCSATRRSIETSRWPCLATGPRAHLTSRAVKGMPSCSLTPSCNLNVSRVLSSSHVQLGHDRLHAVLLHVLVIDDEVVEHPHYWTQREKRSPLRGSTCSPRLSIRRFATRNINAATVIASLQGSRRRF